MAALLVAVAMLGGCRTSGSEDSSAPQALSFELGEKTSAFRDIGKRGASDLE